MSRNRKTKTNKITSVRKVAQAIGDKTNDLYNSTGDLKAAQTALKAYNTAINVAKTQLIYKKLTGTPANIDFLDE